MDKLLGEGQERVDFGLAGLMCTECLINKSPLTNFSTLFALFDVPVRLHLRIRYICN
jgi:hypothetical protein